MSSVPWQHLGINLNEAVRDPDLDDDLVIDLTQPVRHREAAQHLNNPVDPDDVQEGVVDLNNPVFWHLNEQDQEETLCKPDLDAAQPCQKETPGCCELDFSLNESANNGQVVLLPDLNEIPGAVGVPRKKKYYSDETKRAVYARLLEGSRGGRLPDGLTNQVSLAMDVSLRCVQRIWNAGQKGGGIHAVGNKKANCGRKRIEVRPEAITAIQLKDRTTLQNLASHLGMAKSTIFRRVKEGRIERRSIAIHPLFKNEDKSHVQYYRDMQKPQCSSASGFKSSNNMTRMGTKSIYRTKSKQKFYYAPRDEIWKEQ